MTGPSTITRLGIRPVGYRLSPIDSFSPFPLYAYPLFWAGPYTSSASCCPLSAVRC